jgi:DNA segregation ATPase FtsK/SpoIIIE and related proteins
MSTDLPSNPPRLLSFPWSDPRWTPSEHNATSYRPQTTGEAPRKLRIGGLKRVEKPSSKEPSVETSETTASSTSPSRVRSNFKVKKLEEESEPVDIISAAFVPIRSHSTLQKETYPGHIAIFSNDNITRKNAVNALESMALRTICTFPVRKLKCTFIDPIDMGSNFPFNGKLPSLMIGQQVYTSSSDIREQLQSLNNHVQAIIQNRLGKDYKNIEEFNQHNKIVEEAYRYLFIADFPNAFDNNSREIIESLLRNGARVGVYVVIHIDETIEKLRDFNYKNFNNYCTVIQPTGKYYGETCLFTTPLINEQFNILLDTPPPKDQFNQLTNLLTTTFKEIKTEAFPFTDFYPDIHSAWSKKYDSRQQIRAPIGSLGTEGQLEFWMGQNEDGLFVNFGLLAGKPRAGKSYTLHATILSLAMRYAPDELEMYLLDYKKGVEFQIYIDTEITKSSKNKDDLIQEKDFPHAKVISIESDREFGLSVLKYIQNQIEERSQKFKSASNSTNLKEYRDNSGEKLSRILVVIDEFQVLFEESDTITHSLNQIFDNIIKQGPAFGIHLLLATQSPSISNISSSIYKNIELRMAHQMEKSVAGSMLAEGNSDVVELLDRPGKILYNREFGKKSYNQIGQIADVSPEERIKALQYIQQIAQKKGFKRTEPLTVFRGSEPAKLKYNLQLNALFNLSQWLSSKELKDFVQEKDWTTQETPSVAWLGEAMRLGNHTKAIFRRRPRNNMILVGLSEETIFGLLGGILLSLVNCSEPQQAQFNIIDLSSDEDTQWAKMSTTFRDTFQPCFPVTVGKRLPEAENDILKGENLLRQTFEEFESRQEKRKENPDELNFGASLFLIYAVGGLSNAPNLRPVEGRRSEEPSEDAKKLLELLSKGSELGIHVILWLDSMKTFKSLTGDNRSWLGNFDLRVALKMPPDDSRDLLEESYAQNLRSSMAYFWDKAIATEPEKFKPYAVPSVEEIIEYSSKLKKRIF